uniref:Uncharacterized protein n=1 Tax=Panagrolaimus sp. ES5 TaxID=591445 RepID=A0AC34F9G6_9BILA
MGKKSQKFKRYTKKCMQCLTIIIDYRKILQVNKYVPGAHLPPHLSPFVLESSGDYIPPERIEMLRELGKDVPAQKENVPVSKSAKAKPKKAAIEKKDKVLIKEGKVFNQNDQQLIGAATYFFSIDYGYYLFSHTKKLRDIIIPIGIIISRSFFL